MKWPLVSYIIYLALLSAAAFATGIVELEPVVIGAACAGIAAALTAVNTMIACALDIDWYFN